MLKELCRIALWSSYEVLGGSMCSIKDCQKCSWDLPEGIIASNEQVRYRVVLKDISGCTLVEYNEVTQLW